MYNSDAFACVNVKVHGMLCSALSSYDSHFELFNLKASQPSAMYGHN